MRLEDMILVSVDDHVVEPPDMFERPPPGASTPTSRRGVVRKDDGTDVWLYEGQEIPNIGLNAVAGRPPEEYGMEPTSFDEMRDGCYDIDERVRDMNANGVLGSMCFPSFPHLCGQLFARSTDKDAALAILQAYNDWHIDEWCGTLPGPVHPARAAADLGPGADGRRGAPRRGQGLPRGVVLGEPGEARLPEPPRRPLGPVLAGVRATRARSCACTSGRRRRW